MKKPCIVVPIGDPAGVGPEIVAKSIASEKVFEAANCVVVGDRTIMENAIRIVNEDLKVNLIDGPEDADFSKGVCNLIDLANVDMSKFEFGKVNGMVYCKNCLALWICRK